MKTITLNTTENTITFSNDNYSQNKADIKAECGEEYDIDEFITVGVDEIDLINNIGGEGCYVHTNDATYESFETIDEFWAVLEGTKLFEIDINETDNTDSEAIEYGEYNIIKK